MKSKKQISRSSILWIALGVLSIGLLVSWILKPDWMWLTIGVGVLVLATIGLLVREYRKELSSRTAAYGASSAVTVLLVFGILGVINFMGERYPYKLDLTKNKRHTLSDQTEKLVRDLKAPVHATLFAKSAEREKYRNLLSNYGALNPNFKVEYVDPDKELNRAKQAGLKAYNTLHLAYGDKTSRIEDPTEEKLTNALVKLVQEKSKTLCSVSGHGEKDFQSGESEGYEAARRLMEEQGYQVRDLKLLESESVPKDCDAIAIIGPNKAFFAPEVSRIRDYLNQGGRAVFAMDPDLRGGESSPEMIELLDEWKVGLKKAIVIEPIARLMGGDASIAVAASYSREHAVTRNFQAQSFLPFARPLEILPGVPATLKIESLAKSTPASWGETDFSGLSQGKVQKNTGDLAGPLHLAIAVEGKKNPESKRDTRIVVFSSSHMASNAFSRHGGNLDFFLNSVNWVLEDENLISIRAKQEDPGMVTLSQQAGQLIFWITVVIIPLLTAIGGVVIWAVRRKL